MAPARSAAKNISSSLATESARILAPGHCSQIRAVASNPFIFGMTRSMSDDVRLQVECQADCFFPIACFAYHDDVGFALGRGDDCLAYQCMVIGDENANHAVTVLVV